MDNIFEYIKVKRSMRSMSQKDLAQRAGISVNTLIKIEQGQANPTLEVINKIFEILGLELLTMDRNRGVSRFGGRRNFTGLLDGLSEDKESDFIRKVWSVFNTYEQFKDAEGKVRIPLMTFTLLLFNQESVEEDETRLLVEVIDRCSRLVNKLNDQGHGDMRIEDVSLSESGNSINARYVMMTQTVNTGNIFSAPETDVKTTRQITEHIRRFNAVDYVLFEEILGIKDNSEKIKRMDAFLQKRGWDEELRRQYILTSDDFKMGVNDIR